MSSESMRDSLRSLLTNLQVDLIISNVQTVGVDWKRENFIHSFNRLYYIMGGEGRIEVAGEAYYPQPGQLVLMPCHIMQSYATISENTFRKYWCHFTARVGSRDLFELYRFPVCLNVPEPSEVEDLFQRMVAEHQSSSPASILNAQAALLQLIGLFMKEELHETISPTAASRKMSHVLQYIEQHLGEKITVEQLAALAHYHPNYFIRAFHSLLGCSPIQYINRLRLDKARQLLSTDMPIGRIAHYVGIEQHNFSKMFKSYTGFSPRDFRKMLVN